MMCVRRGDASTPTVSFTFRINSLPAQQGYFAGSIVQLPPSPFPQSLAKMQAGTPGHALSDVREKDPFATLTSELLPNYSQARRLALRRALASWPEAGELPAAAAELKKNGGRRWHCDVRGLTDLCRRA